MWKDCIESIMKYEVDWDRHAQGDAAEGPVVCVSREEVHQPLDEM